MAWKKENNHGKTSLSIKLEQDGQRYTGWATLQINGTQTAMQKVTAWYWLVKAVGKAIEEAASARSMLN